MHWVFFFIYGGRDGFDFYFFLEYDPVSPLVLHTPSLATFLPPV